MPAPGTELSDREREVVALLARGMTKQQVAAALFLSENTVRKHVQRACRRTRTHSACHLVAVVARTDRANDPEVSSRWRDLLEREREAHRVTQARLDQAREERDAYHRRLDRVIAAVGRLTAEIEGAKR